MAPPPPEPFLPPAPPAPPKPPPLNPPRPLKGFEVSPKPTPWSPTYIYSVSPGVTVSVPITCPPVPGG